MTTEQQIKIMKFQLEKFENSAKSETVKLSIDATDADGQKYLIDTDTIAIGANIYGIDADGNQTDLTDGEYIIVLTTDSKEYEVTVEKGFIVDFGEVVGEVSTDDAPVQATIVKPNEDYTKLKSEFETLKKEFNDFKKVLKTVTNLASAKPIEKSNKSIQKIVISEDEKFEAIAKVLREVKNK